MKNIHYRYKSFKSQQQQPLLNSGTQQWLPEDTDLHYLNKMPGCQRSGSALSGNRRCT